MRALQAAIGRYMDVHGGAPVLAGLGLGPGDGAAGGGGGGGSMPVYGPGVTINSTSQKLLAKLARKDAKKVREGEGVREAGVEEGGLGGRARAGGRREGGRERRAGVVDTSPN